MNLSMKSLHDTSRGCKKSNHGKKKQRFELEIVLSDITEVVNFVRSHSKKHKMFSELCKDMQVNELKLLYHVEVRWLSRRKVLKRVFQRRNEQSAFLSQERHPMAANFEDVFWLTKLSYLTIVFESRN